MRGIAVIAVKVTLMAIMAVVQESENRVAGLGLNFKLFINPYAFGFAIAFKRDVVPEIFS